MAAAVAFFDFDNTLLAVNSAWLWVRRELRLGHITYWQAVVAAGWMVRYQLGFASLDTALLRVIASLAGVEVAPLRARTEAFYKAELKELYRPGARKALAEHRAKGDRCVLLTSSSNYLAELVAEDLALDHVLCNRLEVDAEGRHTGRPEGEICFGDGKLRHAEAYLQSVGARLADCTFYTDSFADVSVLRVVGRPVAVNPDPRLKREALRRGWAVEDWGRPKPVF